MDVLCLAGWLVALVAAVMWLAERRRHRRANAATERQLQRLLRLLTAEMVGWVPKRDGVRQ